MHYLMVQVENKEMAEKLAASLLVVYGGKDWLGEYDKADGDVIYYAASNLCEDISEVTMLYKKEDDYA